MCCSSLAVKTAAGTNPAQHSYSTLKYTPRAVGVKEHFREWVKEKDFPLMLIEYLIGILCNKDIGYFHPSKYSRASVLTFSDSVLPSTG